METREELDTVAALGVDHAQGYLLARPDTSAGVWRSWVDRRWVSPLRDTPLLLNLDA